MNFFFENVKTSVLGTWHRKEEKIYVCGAQVMITTKGDFCTCKRFCLNNGNTLSEEKELNDFLIKCFNALCQCLLRRGVGEIEEEMIKIRKSLEVH